MKKILFIIMLSFLFNCKEKITGETVKKEQKLSISERKDEKKQKIKENLMLSLRDENLNRMYFKTNVLPLIINFVEIDKEKYFILKKIGEKMSKETNVEAFLISKNNLINEIKKIN